MRLYVLSTQKRMVNLAFFSLLTALISLLSIQFLLLKVMKTISWSFFFCYLSKWECKNIFVVHSYSLFSKFTQLWRLPLLRNMKMWKRSMAKAVLNHFYAFLRSKNLAWGRWNISLYGGLGSKKVENCVIFRKYTILMSFLILYPIELRD